MSRLVQKYLFYPNLNCVRKILKYSVTKCKVLRLIYESRKEVDMSMDFDKLYNTYFMELYSYVMTIMKNRHYIGNYTGGIL